MEDNVYDAINKGRLKLKGNTNKYIAKRLKVSNATVGNYLNGKHYKS